MQVYLPDNVYIVFSTAKANAFSEFSIVLIVVVVVVIVVLIF